MRISHIALSLCLSFGSWHLYGQQNLLPNGNFEQTENNMPWKWHSTTPRTASGAIVLAKDIAVDGNYSLRLSGKDTCITSGHLDGIKPGMEYLLSFSAKCSGSNALLFRAIFYTSKIKDKEHWYKIKEVLLSPDWKRYSFKVRLPEPMEWGERKLEIRFSTADGSALIDDARLEYVETAAGPVLAGRRNLLENPGFDHGVTGWFTCQYLAQTGIDTRKLELDTNIKHSGNASLKLPGFGMGLYSRRYYFKPEVKYTLSFYARTEDNHGQEVNVFIRDMQYKKVSALKITPQMLSREWKRFSMTFQCPNLGENFANSLVIRIDPKSTVWMDSFQLEEGNLSDYYPGPQVGLTFARNGIYEKDVEGKINAVVTTPNSNGKTIELKITGKDLNSSVVLNHRLVLTPDKCLPSISIPVKFSRNGVVEVNTVLLVDGKAVSSAEWRVLVIDGSRDIKPNTLIGTDTNVGSAPLAYVKSRSEFESVAGIGFNRSFYNAHVTRDDAKAVNDSPAILELEKTAYAVEKNAGRRVIIALGPDHFSRLYYDNLRKAKDNPGENEIKDDIAAFARQAAEVARALTGKVDVIEVLNEPNIWRREGKRIMPEELYIRIVKALSDSIRAAAPSIKVAANVNGTDFAYAEKLFQMGLAQYIDVFTVHPYRANAETPSVYDDLVKFRAMVNRFDRKIEVINGEQYYGSRNLIANNEFDRNYCAMTEDETTARIIQTALQGFAADMVPFSLHCNLFTDGIGDCPYYGFSFGAYRTLSRLTSGLESAEQVKSTPQLRMFLFTRKDGKRLLSINTRDRDVTLRFDMKCDSALVCDVEGNRLPSGPVSVGYLPVYYLFEATLSEAELHSRLQRASTSGTGFPLEMSLNIAKNGDLVLNMSNITGGNVDGEIKIVNNGQKTWEIPAKIDFRMEAYSSLQKIFKAGAGNLALAPSSLELLGDSQGVRAKRILKIPKFFIPATQNVPKLDGTLDSWKTAQWIELGEQHLSCNFNPSLPHHGPDDLSAKVAFQWSPEGLYLAAKITDDIFVPASAENMLHNSDSIQIYFSPRVMAGGNSAGAPGDVAYALGVGKDGTAFAWLNCNPGSRFVGANNAIIGIDGDVKCVIRKQQGFYVLEAFFPAQVIPDIKLKSGSIFSLSILINDNDGMGRKQGLTIGPQLTEPYNKSANWPCVQLN